MAIATPSGETGVGSTLLVRDSNAPKNSAGLAPAGDRNCANGTEGHAHGAENARGNVATSDVENQNLMLAVFRQ